MIYIDGNSLSIEDVITVVDKGEKAGIADSAMEQIRKSKKSLMKILESGKPVYV